MALIQCPECGKQVSDSATACPNCGYPLAQAGPKEVRIKTPTYIQGAQKKLFGNTQYVHVHGTGGISWSGSLGSTAKFKISKEEYVDIGLTDGATFITVKGKVEPGCNYTLEFQGYTRFLNEPVYILQEDFR